MARFRREDFPTWVVLSDAELRVVDAASWLCIRAELQMTFGVRAVYLAPPEVAAAARTIIAVERDDEQEGVK